MPRIALQQGQATVELIALLPVNMRLQEKLFVGWVGLRGAVPIVLATFPLLAGVPQSPLIFDLVFFIVVVSVLLHGTTVLPVAKWLGVLAPAEVPVRQAAAETSEPTDDIRGRWTIVD